MKNKKGFTLVELVIVIAVIAILAGVMIGTFASVIDSANKSKALQEWRAAVDEAYLDYVAEYNSEPTIVKKTAKTIEFVKEIGAAEEGVTYFNMGNGQANTFLELTKNVYLLRLSGGFRVVTGTVENGVLSFDGGSANIVTTQETTAEETTAEEPVVEPNP